MNRVAAKRAEQMIGECLLLGVNSSAKSLDLSIVIACTTLGTREYELNG